MTDEATSRPARCGCASCRIRNFMGPIMLITIGVIFLIGQYTSYDFSYLWPILLIVPGVLMVAQALAPRANHAGR